MKQNYLKSINRLLMLVCVIISQYALANVGNVEAADLPTIKSPVAAVAGCSGTSTQTIDGQALTAGYNYNFETIGTDVKITFTLLDTKPGLIAYLWRESPPGEFPMTNTTGQTFTRTITGQTIGSTINYAVKFAYAGGLSVTKYISYVVGDNCSGTVTDTQAPTAFTATAGTVTSSSVQLLLNATDDSGAVTYTITYGANTTTVSGNSGVQQVKVISGLSPSTAYNFSITAKDAAGNLAANNPIVVQATTSVDTSTACAGTSSQAAEGSFSTGYNYSFTTNGTDVTATFTLLDTDKTGVIAYLWRETQFAEWGMTNTSGLTFTKTVSGLTPGTSVKLGVKFAYAGGLSRTKYFTYVVGDTCAPVQADTQAPTGFTAIAGALTSSSVELLLNATDNSGAVTYTITYGANTTTVTGASGVQKSVIINGLSASTPYTFNITAKDASNNTAANNPLTVSATTSVDTNTACSGTSSQAAEGSFSTGYTYNFTTNGTDVTATFTLLDTDKTGVVAYLWRETQFAEWGMANTSGLTFTKTVSGLTPGTSVKLGVKFAYAGGLVRTKYFTYVVGDNCAPVQTDTQAPAAFTATVGTITNNSVELLLNATDDSGSVTYTVTYGATTTTTTGTSGVQKSIVIDNLTHSTAYNFSVTAADATGNAAVNSPIEVAATTLVDTNTACAGTSSLAAEGSFSTGYEYSFSTSGSDVTVTFTLLDTDKTGVVAYLWRQTDFAEWGMVNSGGLTFTKTVSGLTPGTNVNFSVKFAYAGGLSRTKYFTYTVGDTCGEPVADTEAPTTFTATAGTITSSSVELLLNATDNSGAVTYTIAYGSTTTTVAGASGVQQSNVISGLSPDTAYSFSVTAADAAGNLAANNPIVVNTTTGEDTNTACDGTSSAAAEGTFSTGYTYHFETTGTSVTATFTMLDTDKQGLVPYLRREAPFGETPMTHVSGKTYTATLTDIAPGTALSLGVKFAYAGGLVRTVYFPYTSGDNCTVGGGEDTTAPTGFTAVSGTVTAASVELLLNATDDSGVVSYDVTYGSQSTTVTGISGVQRSAVIYNLTPETAYSFTIQAKDAAGNTAAYGPIMLNVSTLEDTSTMCSGSSSQAQQGNFSIGYNYSFTTNGNDVTATFTLLDTDKTGVIAYLWTEYPFAEIAMANTAGLTFRATAENFVPGTTAKFAVKFAYAGGQSVTKYFTYTIGDNCDGSASFNTIWNGTSWSNGAPISGQYNAIIEGDYNSAENGEIVANALIINSGDVVVSNGDNFIITGSVVVDNEESSLTLENNANLIQLNDVTNSGTISVIKDSAPMYRLDYALWGSPVTGETLGGFSPNTLSNRFYRYNTLSDAYSSVPPTTPFSVGEGYLIRVANTHASFESNDIPGTPWTGTFEGVPNNGTITVSVEPYAEEVLDGEGEVVTEEISGYNALSNPYPSPINIQEFYTVNAAALGNDASLYFWRKKNGSAYSSYASLTLGGYIANGQVMEASDGVEINYGDASNGEFADPDESENWVLNSGQGFIVQASGNEIVFTNSMRRVSNNGQIFSTPEETPSKSRLWLNLKNGAGDFHQAMIAYTPATTLGIDFGWDGKALSDGDMAIYSLAGTNKLGIQARPAFDASDVVAMECKVAEAGMYTISLDRFDGLFANGQDIFLRDNLAGAVHDLKLGGYEFTAEAGVTAGRFEVIYAMPLGIEVPAFKGNDMIVYKDGNAIQINTPNAEIESVVIYDLQGRVIYRSGEVNASETTVTGLQAQEQMLIVQVETKQHAKATRKIVF